MQASTTTDEEQSGIKVGCTTGVTRPVIVNVLPDPVCPYAMIVPLYPSKTEVTISLAQICRTAYSRTKRDDLKLHFEPTTA